MAPDDIEENFKCRNPSKVKLSHLEKASVLPPVKIKLARASSDKEVKRRELAPLMNGVVAVDSERLYTYLAGSDGDDVPYNNIAVGTLICIPFNSLGETRGYDTYVTEGVSA